MNLNEIEKELNETKQAKKLTKKMIVVEFDDFLKDKGFVRHKNNVYIKISVQHIIQNITFELLPSGFTCAIAMQPLYIQDHEVSTFLHLTFGNRISRFKVVKNECWSYHEHIKAIADIKELLIKNGLPWFERYNTPDGIINFISNGKINDYGLWLNEFHQKQYLGFSLLYSGRIDEGIQSLKDMLNEISDNAIDYMKEYKMQVIKLINGIKEHPDNAKNIFDGIIKENKLSLKI